MKAILHNRAVLSLLMAIAYGCYCDTALAADSPPTTAPITHSDYSVVEKLAVDEKAVFATVESANVVAARARIGGTIIELKIKQGDRVERDQVIATVGDQKIGLQIQSLEAQARAAQAEVDQTRSDLDRAEKLVQQGYATKARVEQLRTAHNVAINNLKSQTAQQSVVQQQQTEGKVLAPTPGRVLTVPVTAGTVIMAGEPVATIAEQNYILRLSVPERHAAFIKAGDAIRVDGSDLGLSATQSGTIKLIYPKIDNGRLQADAVLNGVGDYFVGERIRVWVSTGTRKALAIPEDYVTTRNGIDFVHLKQSDSTVIEVPVQRGHVLMLPDLPNAIEILSGLKVGDTLVRP
jgi:RND family efflux transporter MFP subunit